MKHYAGIDVSLEYSSVCVVDADGGIVREDKVLSEPETLVAWFAAFGAPMERIGLEAGPLSQWLHAGMSNAGLAVELLETRHVRATPRSTTTSARSAISSAAKSTGRDTPPPWRSGGQSWAKGGWVRAQCVTPETRCRWTDSTATQSRA